MAMYNSLHRPVRRFRGIQPKTDSLASTKTWYHDSLKKRTYFWKIDGSPCSEFRFVSQGEIHYTDLNICHPQHTKITTNSSRRKRLCRTFCFLQALRLKRAFDGDKNGDKVGVTSPAYFGPCAGSHTLAHSKRMEMVLKAEKISGDFRLFLETSRCRRDSGLIFKLCQVWKVISQPANGLDTEFYALLNRRFIALHNKIVTHCWLVLGLESRFNRV